MKHVSVFARSALALSLLGAVAGGPAMADDASAPTTAPNCTLSKLPSPEAASQEAAGAKASVDTSAFKKSGTVKLGVSAGYLSNSRWCSRCNFSSIKPQRTRFSPLRSV